MNKLSVIIIAKNAEEMIADCLESVVFASEIIVVDSGSTDRTQDIAKRMEAKVFVKETSDFSELRNFGFEKAKGEWILYVDTDERVTKDLEESIKKKVLSIKSEDYVVYKVKRKNYYLGNNEWPKIEKLERLFRRTALKGWRGELHESPIIEGSMGELEGYLSHYTHRNLYEMLDKTIKWSKIEAELRLKANHPKINWWRFPRVMFTTFFEYYIRQKGWKVGTAGLVESIYQSFSMFITYARLWEMQRKVRV